MRSVNRLKQQMREGENSFGLFCSIPHPALVEMIGDAGYDFVILDTEHALVNPETLEHLIRAAEVAGLTPLVRVADGAPNTILKALDAGAQGVVVPHVRTKEEAENIVRASRYFPLGERSLNGGRNARFGKQDLVQVMQKANEQVLVVAMIEDREGVENIDQILTVPGLDLILEGAADLSSSLGMPWQTRSDLVREALFNVQAACARHGVPYCAIPRVPEDIVQWQAHGVRTFVLGEERGTAFRALQAHLKTYN